jgi:hypothetical protein
VDRARQRFSDDIGGLVEDRLQPRPLVSFRSGFVWRRSGVCSALAFSPGAGTVGERPNRQAGCVKVLVRTKTALLPASWQLLYLDGGGIVKQAAGNSRYRVVDVLRGCTSVI